MQYKENVLSSEQLLFLREHPDVVAAFEQLQTSSKVSFAIALPLDILTALHDGLGLDVTQQDRIPMRWIRGDTTAHVDKGSAEFQKTYLVYITDGMGEFHLGHESYPIVAGSGFVFPEGVSHEVIGAGESTRLLIGPMSEQGLAVGDGSVTLQGDGATDTLFLREEEGVLQWRLDSPVDPIDWTSLVGAPITIQNTSPNPTNNILKVLFTTNITLTGNNSYFICGNGGGIQFGSSSLNPDGSRTTITVADADTYPGLINNGDVLATGQNSISVYNLSVVPSGTTALDINGGWIAQAYYGRSGTNNYIVNCSSSGDIPTQGGGIVGATAAFEDTGQSAQLYLIGCSSSGAIGNSGGGIVGANAGEDGGEIYCTQCWSEGTLGTDAGGIFGANAGVAGGTADANTCYSLGTIGESGGGIFGLNAGGPDSIVSATNCYSRGNIDTDAGGIFGADAGDLGGTMTAQNCYSDGILTTPGNGIFGSNPSGHTANMCYVSEGSWSDTAANAALSDVPLSGKVGEVWVSVLANTPYELNNFGYTPYTVDIISSNNLIKTFSQTVVAGQTGSQAIAADASGNNFTLLQVKSGDPASYDTFTISQQTGAISTTTSTAAGTYSIYVRSVGSYNISIFEITVEAAPPTPDNGGSQTTVTVCCRSTMDVRGLDYQQLNDYRIGNRLLVEQAQNTKMKYDGYSQYVKMKMAQNQR